MKEAGTRKPHEINKFHEATDLDPKKVEFGRVLIIPQLDIEGRKEATLLIAPLSRIGYHIHDKDNEAYIVLDHKNESGEIISEECRMGRGHFLENTSTDSWLVVKSVKWW